MSTEHEKIHVQTVLVHTDEIIVRIFYEFFYLKCAGKIHKKSANENCRVQDKKHQQIITRQLNIKQVNDKLEYSCAKNTT